MIQQFAPPLPTKNFIGLGFSGHGYQKTRDCGSPRWPWGSKYTMGLELQLLQGKERESEEV